MYDVALKKYEEGQESLRKAIELVDGLQGFSGASKVVIKPNLVLWPEGTDFPKYGVLTTARLIEDLVILLKDHGVRQISLVEGPVADTFRLAVTGMGLDRLAERYGVELVNVFNGQFAKVSAGDMSLKVCRTALEADHLIDLPVMKTHTQTVVSLGIKNLKGLLDFSSRYRCHSTDSRTDLNYNLAKLTELLRPSLTILDGIYTLERGPMYLGDAHRTDVLVASRDLVSADKVGAAVLGFPPQTVRHIALSSESRGGLSDLSDINILGDTTLPAVSRLHQWETAWNKAGDMPFLLDSLGVKGVTWRQSDMTLCSHCSTFLPMYMGAALALAKNRDKPFDDIEVLAGKLRGPEGGHKQTLLVGNCQVKKNGSNPLIQHAVKIRGCPPRLEDVPIACRELGIDLPDNFVDLAKRTPGRHVLRYAGKPEFNDDFFKIR